MGLFESAEDREVNNSALLIDHDGIAGTGEALTEPGHALRVYPLMCFIKAVQTSWVKSSRI